MKVDVYDTYATCPNGALLHFDIIVPVGTEMKQMLQIAREYVGADDPEIEAERSGWKSSVLSRDANLATEIERCGYCIVPFDNQLRAAG